MAVIDEKTSSADLDAMHKSGVRGIRINLDGRHIRSRAAEHGVHYLPQPRRGNWRGFYFQARAARILQPSFASVVRFGTTEEVRTRILACSLREVTRLERSCPWL